MAGAAVNEWWDHGEPEDNSFNRDWAWVPNELNGLATDLAKARAERDAALETLLQIERETYDPLVSKRIDVAMRRLKGGS